MSFSEFNDHWPTKPFKPCRWVTWRNSKDRKWLGTFSTAKSQNFSFKFWTFSFFLYDVITDKARNYKLHSRISSWQIFLPLSLSVSAGVSFLLFLVHVLSLAHYFSLSLLVDDAFQLPLCGVMSSSITLTSRPFN